jgi:UrcA family protein
MRRLSGPGIAATWIFLPCAYLSIAGVAFAQDEAEGTPEKEIVVVAPRPITAEIVESSPGNREKAVISLKMVVQYGDLDLRKAEDQDRLMVRIRSVARDACRYLDRLYPLDPDSQCEARAVADTKPLFDKAVVEAAP